VQTIRKAFVQQVFKGRSLLRIFQNMRLSTFSVSGRVLDLGGGPGSQYYDYIGKDPGTQLSYADLYQITDDHLVFDFEGKFSIGDSHFDNVMLMNVLEHIYDTQNLVTESYRVLRPGGRIVGVVPFMYQIHGVPNDYWRPTEQSLIEQMTRAGFRDIEVAATGEGMCLVMASMAARKLKFKPLTWAIYFFAEFCDKFSRSRKQFPLGYYFTATKDV